MCTAPKFNTMRNLFFFLFICASWNAFGQSNNNENVPATNSNTFTPDVKFIKVEVDTLVPQEESFKEVEKKQDKAVSKKTKSPSESESLNEESIQSSAAVSETAVKSISISKIQASQNRTQRSPSPQFQQQMDDGVKTLEAHAPESFEFHFYKYLAGNYNIQLAEHLLKAEQLKPNNSDVQIQKAAYYIILSDSVNAVSYLKKIEQSTRISKEALAYAEDIVLSAPENGTLITHGFDDSYASYYIQYANKQRPDLTIVSLDFLQSDVFRDNLKKKGYVLPENKIIDVNYLKLFCELNEKKSIAISLTTPKEYLNAVSQNIFIVGLVAEYHKDLTFNNFYRNDYLWNEVLQKKLVNSAVTEKGRQLSANYLPMMIYLSKIYGEVKEVEKQNEVEKAIEKVAVQSNKYEQVRTLKKSF